MKYYKKQVLLFVFIFGVDFSPFFTFHQVFKEGKIVSEESTWHVLNVSQ